MVTFAQAQERAEEWINGDVPAYQHREVRVREFELGFVVWAEDRAEGPSSDGGRQRLVIARDSGEATLWPGLPVGEVIRRYEEEYGVPDEPEDEVPPRAPERIDLNQTSFLLTPPEWLQEAADRMGIPDAREPDGTPAGAATAAGEGATPVPAQSGPGQPGPGQPAPAQPGPGQSGPAWPGAAAPAAPGEGAASVPAQSGPAQPGPGQPAQPGPGQSGPAWPGAAAPAASGSVAAGAAAAAGEDAAPAQGAPAWPGATPPPAPAQPGPAWPGGTPAPSGGVAWPAPTADVPSGATPWAGTDTNAGSDEGSVPLPATVFAPPLSGSDADDTPPPRALPEAKTALLQGGSQLPPTAIAPALDPQAPAPGVPGGPGVPPGPGVPGAPATPVGPGSPGAPGAPAGSGTPVGSGGPGAPGGPAVPPGPGVAPGPGAPGAPGTPVGHGGPGAPGAPGGPGQPGAPGQPPAPAAPGAPGAPVGPAGPGASGAPGAGRPSAADIADAATSKAAPPRGARGSTPPPPGEPGVPGARAGAPAYVPTQMVSQLGPDGPQPAGPPTPPPPGGGVHHAATMLADPSQLGPGGPGGPGGPQPPSPPGPPGAPGAGRAPQPPGPPGAPGVPQPPGPPGVPGAPQPPGPPGVPGGSSGGGAHYAATMLADPNQLGPGGRPGAPQPPGPPGAPATPPPPGGGVHHAATMLAGPAQMGPGAPQPPAYGYPQQPTGLPTVGPGYQAVLRYRAADGSEQQLIRRSAPGIPHPEWQIFHELRGMNVPPDHVLELHTELASCELPGGYCARMIRETWPQVRITSVAPYGTDHASRRQGVQHLLTHQGELAQVADGPARPQPVRAPLPQVQPAPPLPPEGVAHELAGAFGPQGVFRFDQRAVSRQGVPEAVAVTLVWAGLPADFGPFFWAQAVPGQPVPTLAELAAQRQVQAAPDAGSYLVMGSDFGRAICVQYGTANIVAVPVEAGPGGQSVPPQFVNTGLPEFVRCMALLGHMWRLRYGLNPEQAGRWTVDFQAQLAALDPAALASPESWWSVLLEQFWDGLL
ncbi:SUKH-4 family immunity protein [Streptomyces sp. NPDC023838]|uniref:SUKH-4 family immunity protein n=1 Tax=Streptomyces sp. NPDC023838 TaxID=3154325 RepID=UPI00340AF214